MATGGCCHADLIWQLPSRARAQVYCLAFEALDAQWLGMRASYMEFPAVMKRVEQLLDRALSAQPASLGELRRLLL